MTKPSGCCTPAAISYVSGGTGSGNTTLLNVLIALIPDDQRIVGIEDTLELRIDSPNCVRFEARRLQQGALTDPFTKLASTPTKFIGLGLSWKNDFTGIPRGIASSVENMGETGKSFRESWEQRLTDADTVSETDILNLFQDSNPEGAERASRAYLAAREGSDNRLVLDHATSDRSDKSHYRGERRRGLLRTLAGKHQHIQHRACSIASHRSSDARPPHRCYGSVDGIPGGEGGGERVTKARSPGAKRWPRVFATNNGPTSPTTRT